MSPDKERSPGACSVKTCFKGNTSEQPDVKRPVGPTSQSPTGKEPGIVAELLQGLDAQP